MTLEEYVKESEKIEKEILERGVSKTVLRDWIAGFEGEFVGTMFKALQFVRECCPVTIFQTDEAWGKDDFHWVVGVEEPEEDECFWLEVFDDKQEAIDFCEALKLDYEVLK